MGHPFCFGWARENKDNSSGKIKRRSKQRDATATAQWPMEGLHPTLRQRREGWGTRFLLAGEREQDNSGDAHRVPPLHPTLRQRREGWGTRFVFAAGERTRQQRRCCAELVRLQGSFCL